MSIDDIRRQAREAKKCASAWRTLQTCVGLLDTITSGCERDEDVPSFLRHRGLCAADQRELMRGLQVLAKVLPNCVLHWALLCELEAHQQPTPPTDHDPKRT